MLDWIVELLEKYREKSSIKRNARRKKKIKRLMMELYRESALFKVPVEDLDYMKSADIKNNIKYRWFIDCVNEFLN